MRVQKTLEKVLEKEIKKRIPERESQNFLEEDYLEFLEENSGDLGMTKKWLYLLSLLKELEEEQEKAILKYKKSGLQDIHIATTPEKKDELRKIQKKMEYVQEKRHIIRGKSYYSEKTKEWKDLNSLLELIPDMIPEDEPRGTTIGEPKKPIKDILVRAEIFKVFNNSNEQSYWKSLDEITELTGYSVGEVEKALNSKDFIGRFKDDRITTRTVYEKYTSFFKQVLDLMKNNYN